MRNSENGRPRIGHDHGFDKPWDNRPAGHPGEAKGIIKGLHNEFTSFDTHAQSVELFLAHAAFEVTPEFTQMAQQTHITKST
jgi:hypothetical protein